MSARNPAAEQRLQHSDAPQHPSKGGKNVIELADRRRIWEFPRGNVPGMTSRLRDSALRN